jgi:hypothetical protein
MFIYDYIIAQNAILDGREGQVIIMDSGGNNGVTKKVTSSYGEN